MTGPAKTSVESDIACANEKQTRWADDKSYGERGAIIQNLEPYERIEEENPAGSSNASKVNSRKCLSRIKLGESLSMAIHVESLPCEQ